MKLSGAENIADGPFDWEIHRSSFQKCMRRGLPALAWSHFQRMYMEDDKKAFDCLALVAGEDIGFPVLEMTALALMMCLKTFRQQIQINELTLARGLIARLARSPKNRFGCQLNVYVDVLKMDATSVENPDKVLTDMLTHAAPHYQFAALRTLRKKCRHGNVELLKTVIRILKDSFETKAMGLAAAIVFERQNDDIHFGQIITAQMCLGAGYTMIPLTPPQTEPLETRMINQFEDVYTTVPNCALDQHTSIGRSALLRWAKTDKMQELFKPYGIDNGKIQKALGAITFFKDASMVSPDLGIADEGVNKLIVKQEIAYTMARSEIAGLTEETYSKLTWDVMADVHELYDLRQFLWKKG
jgi:hypothetical protein